MGKKIAAVGVLCFLIAMPLMSGAASIRKGISLEMKGGYYRPSDSDTWNECFGRTFSAFGGLTLSREILKNIEFGMSADYLHPHQREWPVYIVPMGLTLTYVHRRSQDQVFVPYLGGGGDFVYGKTGKLALDDRDSSHLKEPGYHITAGMRILLNAANPEDANAFDQKYGVNNSYLVFQAKYLQLFDDAYADQELPEGEKGTGYFDPRGIFLSLGILFEF